MRHPIWGFELPDVVVRLLKWLEPDRERRRIVEVCIGDLDAALTPDRSGYSELNYAGQPFEEVPLFWNKGDALRYGLIVHAEGLVHPMSSYAPGDDHGPLWLGDDAAQGIANLLAVNRDWAGRTPAWEFSSEAEIAAERREVAEAVDEVAAVLGLRVPDETPELTEGARSERDVVPTREGWTFEECNDDVGVFAPSSTFDPQLDPRAEGIFDLDADLAQADDLLVRGYPASALAVARNAYHFTAFEADKGTRAARVMQRAYAALGRDWLARRVDVYVDLQRADGATVDER
jgi:hypothetical protein